MGRAIALALLAAATPLLAPPLLAFPHRTTSNGHRVWSERPIDQRRLDATTARANALVAASGLAAPGGERRDIFLTDGGWRWRWLALNDAAAPALTRPLNEAIIINARDVRGDTLHIARAIGNKRRLSGTIAHEIGHGMIRRELGWRALTLPRWLSEGLCDHIAQESALSDAEAAAVRNDGHPALLYYDGRRRVERELATGGGDPRRLLARY